MFDKNLEAYGNVVFTMLLELRIPSTSKAQQTLTKCFHPQGSGNDPGGAFPKGYTDN